jgi:thiol-disulfide isomerase/thioredoxin
MLRITPAILMLLCTTISACNEQAVKAAEDKMPAIAKPAVRLSNLRDEPVSIDDYKGKMVFLNFWATWCKPCLYEMPSIVKARELLAGEDIVFLFASDETNEEIEQFRKQHDFPFEYLKADNLSEIGVSAIPATFLYDQEGQLVHRETGLARWDDPKHLTLIRNLKKAK